MPQVKCLLNELTRITNRLYYEPVRQFCFEIFIDESFMWRCFTFDAFLRVLICVSNWIAKVHSETSQKQLRKRYGGSYLSSVQRQFLENSLRNSPREHFEQTCSLKINFEFEIEVFLFTKVYPSHNPKKAFQTFYLRRDYQSISQESILSISPLQL